MLSACVVPSPVGNLAGDPRSAWTVAGPEEVVGWFTFDPTSVDDQLPEFVRFVTVGELANGGVLWAVQYLSVHPSHAARGVSFLEIVRADTFAIDGREPNWPEGGAAAVWFARILPKDSSTQFGSGLPLLMLEFWVPDSSYVTFMRQRGHYATYGDVRLRRRHDRWEGSIAGADLTVSVRCTPSGAESGGPSSSGSQVLVPPETSGLRTIIHIAFAGHRERSCSEATSWTIQGRHPLTSTLPIESASFQSGYRLRGWAETGGPGP
jgi:hypothetical protein